MVYCEAKRILEAYENRQGSVQSLIAQSRYTKFKNSLTCLIMKTISYKRLLNKLVRKSKILDSEKFLGETLARLLVYDVLFGMGVRGKFKGTVKRNYARLNEALEHYMKKYNVPSRESLLQRFDTVNQSADSGRSATSTSTKPKYIYASRLMLTKRQILARLAEAGYELVRRSAITKSETTEEDENLRFKNFIDSLGECQFVKDNHVRNVYVFKYNSNLTKGHDLFREGHLLQIDKSSCLVPLALSPPADSHVIDAASAPGNKTIMLSNILANTGLIHAFDIDETRVKLMIENLKLHQARNVRLKCQDFLQTDVTKYERVEYIMLDVPCSGSGMVSRLKYGDLDIETKKDDKRLRNLEALQRRMLLHAMSFASVKRIVYSTCSIHQEEDENVVRYALKRCNKRFKLVNLFAEWPYGRGVCTSDKDVHVYHMDYCVRMSYESNFTNGFFIACFELCEEAEADHADADANVAGVAETGEMNFDDALETKANKLEE